MLIKTARFGNIKIDPERIITFPEGIPGLEKLKKYILLSPEDMNPLQCLQSVEDGDIAFVLTSPFTFKPDYAFDLSEDVIKLLQVDKPEQVAVFSILVIPEDYKQMTANLMAPIIINTGKLLGKQLILDKGDYPMKYRIFGDTDLEPVAQKGG